jgi:hypothetical protein
VSDEPGPTAFRDHLGDSRDPWVGNADETPSSLPPDGGEIPLELRCGTDDFGPS